VEFNWGNERPLRLVGRRAITVNTRILSSLWKRKGRESPIFKISNIFSLKYLIYRMCKILETVPQSKLFRKLYLSERLKRIKVSQQDISHLLLSKKTGRILNVNF
jgi:hypothetical protein